MILPALHAAATPEHAPGQKDLHSSVPCGKPRAQAS